MTIKSLERSAIYDGVLAASLRLMWSKHVYAPQWSPDRQLLSHSSHLLFQLSLLYNRTCKYAYIRTRRMIETIPYWLSISGLDGFSSYRRFIPRFSTFFTKAFLPDFVCCAKPGPMNWQRNPFSTIFHWFICRHIRPLSLVTLFFHWLCRVPLLLLLRVQMLATHLYLSHSTPLPIMRKWRAHGLCTTRALFLCPCCFWLIGLSTVSHWRAHTRTHSSIYCTSNSHHNPASSPHLNLI